MASIIFGKNGPGVNGPHAMFYLARAEDAGMSPNAAQFLSVAYGERSVSASHADAGLKRMNGEGHGTLVFT